ncbi:Holliday junction resolvase RecU [Paenibacillus sp. MER 180]|uniref:Holliday junction resolvase RecU n=1 Tax=Paenibacillus sp. MER 180 TaxID=2939570 RepID=UPI00204189CA|nr:Holliday junction resolvase RecU [Paenibacillus sp. MER 180]MCM3294227.1 Holliday junction resolvase RecU [Paenibacillus sp. MER 180]
MSHANRGMAFESLIDYTNEAYDRNGKAVINKRPTPVKVTRSRGSKVMAGFFEKPSTVDYDGVANGRAIAFEAKSVESLTRFDISNMNNHQYEYLEKYHRQQGIAFLLIHFTKLHKTYLMQFETLRSYWLRSKEPKGRKSIPIDDFEMHAYEVPTTTVPVDYLSVVERVYVA